jgi:hypothetical protein
MLTDKGAWLLWARGQKASRLVGGMRSLVSCLEVRGRQSFVQLRLVCLTLWKIQWLQDLLWILKKGGGQRRPAGTSRSCHLGATPEARPVAIVEGREGEFKVCFRAKEMWEFGDSLEVKDEEKEGV